jgi:hypothetical protein
VLGACKRYVAFRLAAVARPVYIGSMTKNPIMEQLEAARDEVAQHRAHIERHTRLLEVAQARLEAYEFSVNAIESAAPKSKAGRVIKSRNRLPSAEWQRVMQFIAKAFPDGFGYAELVNAALILGVDTKRDSLRTKMMNYANDGHVERIDNGRFKVTPKGNQYFQIEAISATKENGAANAAPDAGTVGVQPPPVTWNNPFVSPSS